MIQINQRVFKLDTKDTSYILAVTDRGTRSISITVKGFPKQTWKPSA